MSMADGFLSNMLISCCHLWPRVIHLRFSGRPDPISPNDQLTIGWEKQKGEQDILLTNVYNHGNHGNHGHPVPKNSKNTLVKTGKHLCPDVPGLAFHFLSRSSRNRMVVPYSSPSQSLRLGNATGLEPSPSFTGQAALGSSSRSYLGHQSETNKNHRPPRIKSFYIKLTTASLWAHGCLSFEQGPHDFSVVANPPNIFESIREKIKTSNQIWEINRSPNSKIHGFSSFSSNWP